RALQLFVEHDAKAGPAHPNAELEVFDSVESPASEAADCLEDVATDRPASGPERRGCGVGLLMREVMEEVAILRDDPRCARRSIIGSEQGLELGVRVESPANPVKRVGSHDDIGVHEED